jgi:hypothetical protein
MAMEGPSMSIFKSFVAAFLYREVWLPISARDRQYVQKYYEDLQSMIKIIFMSLPVNIFCTCECRHLRKQDIQQTGDI